MLLFRGNMEFSQDIIASFVQKTRYSPLKGAIGWLFEIILSDSAKLQLSHHIRGYCVWYREMFQPFVSVGILGPSDRDGLRCVHPVQAYAVHSSNGETSTSDWHEGLVRPPFRWETAAVRNTPSSR